MTTKELLEQLRGMGDIVYAKRRQYTEIQEEIQKYSDFPKLTNFYRNCLEDIESTLLDLMMRKYVADARLLQLGDPEAIEIIRNYYYHDIPFDYIADDYPQGKDYVIKTFNEAMEELERIDKRMKN